jgi:DNA-binding response OmpR family regulator
VSRILVIDDDAGVRATVRSVLELAGHDVIVGEDGLRGVGMAQHQRPDLIVLDLMMPMVDGFATLHILGSDARTATIPVIVLTALTGEAEHERCRNAGATQVLVKPFDPEGLIASVDRVFDEPA